MTIINLTSGFPQSLPCAAYHQKKFVTGCRERGVSPHATLKQGVQVDGLDGRTTASAGYRTSQKIRKRVEEIFGWMKTAYAISSPSYGDTEYAILARPRCRCHGRNFHVPVRLTMPKIVQVPVQKKSGKYVGNIVLNKG